MVNYQEKASAEARGELFGPNCPVKFEGDFLVLSVGFFLGKQGGKIHTQNFTARFKPALGSFAAKIHTARICPW